jgi:CHAT domain-containing protein
MWAAALDRRARTSVSPDLRHLSRLAAGSLAVTKTPESLRRGAWIALLVGRTSTAVAELQEATVLAPEDATLKSDLAAAHLQLGAEAADASALPSALDAASRALDRDPYLLCAQFNRALTLEKLELRGQAITQWRQYLAHESDRRWLGEAREHLSKLLATPQGSDCAGIGKELEVDHGPDTQSTERIVARCPEQAREYVGDRVLVKWADSEASGRQATAERLLTLGMRVADQITASAGDRLLKETLEQITRLQSKPRMIGRLAQAFHAYGEGIAQLQHGRFRHALAPLKRAELLLALERSPFAGWASYQLAVCHYQHSDYRRARQVLGPLVRDADRERYLALHGHALWLVGLIDIIEGSPGASVTALESALVDFHKLNERLHLARLGALLASDFDYLGQPEEAWRRLLPWLLDPSTLDDPLTRSNLCQMASWLTLEQAEPEAALWFQNEVLYRAEASGAVYAIVEALRLRASILARLGKTSLAVSDLEQAARELGRMSDSRLRKTLETDVRLVHADLAGMVSSQEALSLLDDAIQMFRTTSYHYGLVRALHARARLELTLVKDDDAERDLSEAISESETQRERIASFEERAAYFDRRSEIIDDMIAFQIHRRHRPAAALRFSEQARARVLLDWIVAQPADGRALGPVVRAAMRPTALGFPLHHVPSDTVVLEYALLPQSLIIWVVSQDRLQLEEIPVDSRTLGGLIDALYQTLKRQQLSERIRISERLYDIVIRPVSRYIRPGERIIAIPDGALHKLSFALLHDAERNRYLVQDHVCSVSPSARIFFTSLQRDAQLARWASPRALVITDPTFDREIYPSLPPLPATAASRSLAEEFPGSRLLTHREATRLAFLTSAGDFSIIHFAGHAIMNPEYPMLSHLLFAADKLDPARGILYSRDLFGHHFRSTRLAVLASCETALGRTSHAEGVESLARPFLAAGVPAVIGSLWKVDDSATADFFARFYLHLKRKFDVGGALQATQVDALAQGSGRLADPLTWGAFELIGGNSR